MKREQIEAEFDKSYLTPHNEIPKEIKTLAIDFAEHIAKLEREECAKIAYKYEPTEQPDYINYASKEIRAMGNK